MSFLTIKTNLNLTFLYSYFMPRAICILKLVWYSFLIIIIMIIILYLNLFNYHHCLNFYYNVIYYNINWNWSNEQIKQAIEDIFIGPKIVKLVKIGTYVVQL